MAANKTNFLEDYANGGAVYQNMWVKRNVCNFEDGTTQDWRPMNADIFEATIEKSYNGNYSLKVVPTAGNTAQANIAYVNNDVIRETNNLVKIKFAIYATGYGIQFRYADKNGANTVIYLSYQLNQWQEFTIILNGLTRLTNNYRIWFNIPDGVTFFLDDVYVEEILNGKHGFVSHNVDLNTFWANNGWGTLDGVNDLVDMGDTLNPGTSNAIYMLWTKIPSGQTSRAILSKWRDTNAGFSMETSANGRLIAKVSDGTTTLTTVDDGPVITDNSPRIVAIVIDRLANKLKRYVADANGVQKIGTDLDITGLGNIANTFNFYIGARDNTTIDGNINMQFGMAPQYIFPDDSMMQNNAYESQIIGYFLEHTKGIYL